jgi:methylmalonyl-CoA/ethylmalonyl-CoA epimerase
MSVSMLHLYHLTKNIAGTMLVISPYSPHFRTNLLEKIFISGVQISHLWIKILTRSLFDIIRKVKEGKMKIEKIDHISISVKNLDETLKFYTDTLGVKKSDIEEMTIPNAARMATIKTAGAKIELLQFLDPKDILAKFGNPAADSLHHFGVNVDDIVAALAGMNKQGGTLISEKPSQMPNGRKVAFALPKNSHVLIEFLED